jgi:hypothetical protein
MGGSHLDFDLDEAPWSEGNKRREIAGDSKRFKGILKLRGRTDRQDSSSKETRGIGGMEEIFRDDYPPGGYEVLSKPPLGKCSPNR